MAKIGEKEGNNNNNNNTHSKEIFSDLFPFICLFFSFQWMLVFILSSFFFGVTLSHRLLV
jgi:hypothetical protein